MIYRLHFAAPPWIGALLTSLTVAAALSSAPVRAADCKLGVVAELPVTMSAGHAVIKGSINGVDAEFLADSGAFYSMLSKGSAERFKLKRGTLPFGFTVVGVGGEEQNVYLGIANDFDLVGLHGGPVHKVEFIVGGNAFAKDTSGVIGQNVLALGDTEFDLANGLIRLIRARGCAGRDLAYWRGSRDVAIIEVSRTTPAEPHIVGTATLNGTKIRVIFDSGAQGSYLTKRAAERAGVRVTDPGVESGGGVGGGIGRRAVETWIASFKSLDLGGEQINNIKLRVGDFDSRVNFDLLLGTDFLMSHRVYFAHEQHKVFFTYNGGRVFDLSRHSDLDSAPIADDDANPMSDAPTDASGFLRRGVAFAARRDYAHALADFDHAEELDPTNAEIYYQRALARWWNRQAVLAMGDLDQALRLSPGMVSALMTRGDLRLASNDEKGAAADFAAAEHAASGDAYQSVRVGSAYLHRERYALAIAAFNRWIENNAKDDRLADVLNQRCWARASWGKELDLALKDCEDSLRRKPKSSDVLDSRGLVKLRLGDLDGAIADYGAAIALQPKSAFSLYGLGLAQARKGMAAEADASMKAAAEIHSTIADDYKKIGLGRDP